MNDRTPHTSKNRMKAPQNWVLFSDASSKTFIRVKYQVLTHLLYPESMYSLSCIQVGICFHETTFPDPRPCQRELFESWSLFFVELIFLLLTFRNELIGRKREINNFQQDVESAGESHGTSTQLQDCDDGNWKCWPTFITQLPHKSWIIHKETYPKMLYKKRRTREWTL